MNTRAVSMRDRARRAPNGIVAAAAVALTVMATWLSPARLPAEEQNLAAGRNGAQVIKYTSEQGGPWPVHCTQGSHGADFSQKLTGICTTTSAITLAIAIDTMCRVRKKVGV